MYFFLAVYTETYILSLVAPHKRRKQQEREKKMTKYASIQNIENGVEALIKQMTNGNYSVSLKDTDSDLTVPTIRIFKEYDAAYAYAQKIIN